MGSGDPVRRGFAVSWAPSRASGPVAPPRIERHVSLGRQRHGNAERGGQERAGWGGTATSLGASRCPIGLSAYSQPFR